MSDSDLNLPWVALGATVAYVVGRTLFSWYTGRNGTAYPYPPGPKGYPLINNLLDIPVERAHEGYTSLSKQYGDMVFLRAFDTPILILSLQRRITDLLERRSSIYSGRPHSVVMHELLDFDDLFSVADYGPGWRKHRSAFHQHFHMGVTKRYHDILGHFARRHLIQLSEGGNLIETTRNTIAGQTVQIVYGVEVKGMHDPFISDALEIAQAFKDAGVPGKFLVESLPFLKHLPAWLPGAGFQRWAEHYRQATRRAVDTPFESIWKAHVKHEAKPCMATALIDKFPEDESHRAQESHVARNVCTQAHLAAVDTTNSATMTFFLALTINPQMQAKAQEELDRVVGQFVPPRVEQLYELPYMHALIKETLRWHQILPIGLPHRVSEDDLYDGYFIPKGTMIIANVWAIMHDPEKFDNPMQFDPERYLINGRLSPEVDDPSAGFGFGRRICPGRHLAIEAMFSIVASTLALYNISPPKGEDGIPIKVEAAFTDGAIMEPQPLDYTLTPRSAAALATIRDMKHTV